jgi:iron complex outermembrane receptor protein
MSAGNIYSQIIDSIQTVDSIQVVDSINHSLTLKEIIITAKQGINRDRQAKPLSTIEEYLQDSEKVNMIKRGNYAWEPTINNMSTERISVTVDGMKIFHACTDRMDPITSYVETINLSKVSIGSGFEGNPNASNNIGGSIDLKLNRAGFCGDGWDVNANLGYESNGNYRIYGADMAYASPVFYVNSGLFHRNSDNYNAGGNEEIPFSQFTKTNVFTNFGYLIGNKHAIEGTFIYDRASDVGYPALTMDVKKAEGLITSLSYLRENLSDAFSKWETKVYYNNIVHIMDDTQRPNVAIHMDMPGKSRTGGMYSTLEGRNEKHHYSFNWDAYYNQSYAEMTMYPANPNEKPMFMYTWPDIRTFNTGIFAVDEYRLTEHHSFRLSSKLSFQRDGVRSDFGLSTLQIYYPEMQQYRNRWIGNASARYQFKSKQWEITAGGGYGTRSPSPSEAYGFYLFNSFDTYDYLGNPELKNESSIETNFSLVWKNKTFRAEAGTSCFYFTNYIIGKPNNDLYPMTIGSPGVKVYENLPHASIFNSHLILKYGFLNYFSWNGRLTYSLGKDDGGGYLPLISPFTYGSSLSFKKLRYFAEAGIEGAARQSNYSPQYGEDATGAYLITNLSLGYDLRIHKTILNLKIGVENLFDEYYSTYSDWNNIPRKGRSLFINLNINLL